MTEEMFDVVNEDDQVTGQEKRSVVHQTGLWHRGVHVWLFLPDGRLLIQRRTDDRPTEPGMLDCSVSEHVQAGEDYLAGAQRGLKEELGLQGIDLRPIVKFKMNYAPQDNEISQLFQGRLADSQQVKFDPVEVQSVSYTELDEMQRWLDDGLRPFTRWMEQMLRWVAHKPNEMEILGVFGEPGNFPP